MKILIVGSSAREHAFAWRLSAGDPSVEVTVVPGNPGIAREYRCLPTEVTPDLLRQEAPDLVVVGSAAPLVAGLADEVRRLGIPVVGPPGEAARLGDSKTAAKEMMVRHGIPTPSFRSCTDTEEALAAVDELGIPVVVKADGLTRGSGVTVCTSRDAAEVAIDGALRQRRFGAAGERVVIEKHLRGDGVSLTVLVDESGYLLMPVARSYEQAGEGGQGPNTSGMGAIIPNPAVSPEIIQVIESRIIKPSVEAIHQEAAPGAGAYRGFLHFGLILTGDGPQMVDYKIRFGDPEAQVTLPLLEGNFATLLLGLARGRLMEAAREASFGVRPGAACSVVAVSAGYPGPSAQGELLRDDGGGPDETRAVFYHEVREEKQILSTAGGRVFTVSAVGDDPDQARLRAYQRMLQISFRGISFRRDIGGDAIISRVMEEGTVFLPQFSKRGGILPVVVQEADSGDILMVAYANAQALEHTLASGRAAFWSTSRNKLWIKGETSGDTLTVEEVRVDCDQDALLYRVRLNGQGVCHTQDLHGNHRRRCFYRSLQDDGQLFFDEGPGPKGCCS
ncbi:phosphoribosylamine--glycine ligase /phosphoribosyl-AMP cyclohydrolase [Alkalispirochaeta americana]|uniref:Phosphoribosylamine--glycine ligase n=1 Tax=Alkalispirochaeta americana TaxID=159291 RepID=A0A1N6N8L9_9SPIO|nr:phosphoribosylamine--glycine ligase [Alkalispirochaeta americana]SIP88401.1 phosphoribosylamine--glycine ligase /phosphoribosyl-AMP cyclohydrolase [Alkalispirochaeta americana]